MLKYVRAFTIITGRPSDLCQIEVPQYYDYISRCTLFDHDTNGGTFRPRHKLGFTGRESQVVEKIKEVTEFACAGCATCPARRDGEEDLPFLLIFLGDVHRPAGMALLEGDTLGSSAQLTRGGLPGLFLILVLPSPSKHFMSKNIRQNRVCKETKTKKSLPHIQNYVLNQHASFTLLATIVNKVKNCNADAANQDRSLEATTRKNKKILIDIDESTKC